MLSSVEDCHCYACKRGWTTEFMNTNFPLSFRGKTLRMHRRTILLSREKSLLPAMQVFVEAKRNYNEAQKAVKALMPQYQIIYKEYQNLIVQSRVASNDYYLKVYGQKEGAPTISDEELAESKRAYTNSNAAVLKYKKSTYHPMARLLSDATRQLNYLYRIYSTGNTTGEAATRREFLMHCPAPECRGFISSSYVCGTCTLKTCSDCLELIQEEHVCKPESIESAKAIKKETRSCPKCAARIFKIDGCDQMWCTVDGCNTAFSWNTGHIVSGRVHNPHYYEWLRRNGGAGGQPEREVGDIPCGGLPNQRNFVYRILDCVNLNDAEKNILLEINRNLLEFEERLTHFPARMNALANKEINVKYLMKEISEAEWQRQLEFTEAKFTRKKEIGQILQTFVTVSAEIMAGIYEHAADPTDLASTEWIRNTGLPNLIALKEYTNNAFMTLGKLMKIAVPMIGDGWRWQPIRVHYRGPPALDVVPAFPTPVEEVTAEVNPPVEDIDSF